MALKQDRSDWYRPLWTLNGHDLTNGLRIPIQSTDSAIRTLNLRARDFWVLTLDPDSPDSGIYASWGKGAELGTPFILVVREEFKSDMDLLKDRGLLTWNEVSEVFESWCEYLDVMVLVESEAWSTLNLANEALGLALQPHRTFSVGFEGGLPAPGRLSWYVGYPPRITLASAISDAILSIYDEHDNRIHSCKMSAGDSEATELPLWLPGKYRVIVKQGIQNVKRTIQMRSLEEAQPAKVDFEEIAQANKLSIYGTSITGLFHG